jgi:flagellar hook-length control protein FliK
MPALDQLSVAGPAADHVDGSTPKPADRPAAASGTPGSPTQVVPLVAANRSNTLAPVDEAPAAAAAPATVPEQNVSAVVPLHGRGDGRHEVTLELRPDDLGTIRVEVSVEHQTVHLTLHAADPATSRLLSAGLADLRSALADAGLTAGQVGVGLDGGGGAGFRRRSADAGDGDLRRPGGSGPRLTATDEPIPVRTFRPVAAGRLDLFL